MKTHEDTPECRVWQRNVFHQAVDHILKPLEHAMWYVVRLLCDDIKERFCVPVLCQYIADFEEQTLCGGLYGRSCPKCTAWSARLEIHRPSQVNYSSVNNGCRKG